MLHHPPSIIFLIENRTYLLVTDPLVHNLDDPYLPNNIDGRLVVDYYYYYDYYYWLSFVWNCGCCRCCCRYYGRSCHCVVPQEAGFVEHPLMHH